MSKLIKFTDSSDYNKGEFRKIMSKQEADIKKRFSMITSIQAYYYKCIGAKCIENNKNGNNCASDMYNGSAYVTVTLGSKSYRFNKQILDKILEQNVSLLSSHLTLAKKGQDTSKTVSTEKFEVKAHPIVYRSFAKYLSGLNKTLSNKNLAANDDYRKKLFFRKKEGVTGVAWPSKKDFEVIMRVFEKKLSSKNPSSRLDKKFRARLAGLKQYLEDTDNYGNLVNLEDKLIPYGLYNSLLALYGKYKSKNDNSDLGRDYVIAYNNSGSNKGPLTILSRFNKVIEIDGKYDKESKINRNILNDVNISDEGYYVYDKNHPNSDYSRYLYGYYCYCYFSCCNILNVGELTRR